MFSLKIALSSLKNRLLAVTLCVLSIATCTFLFLGVTHLNKQLKDNFSNVITDTDLIVGARTGEEQLILNTLFHLNTPRNNISYSLLKQLRQDKNIQWATPLSFGESHKGFKVIATDSTFFQNYKFGDHTRIKLQQGKQELGTYQAILGSSVAQKLQYQTGSKLVLQHGSGAIAHHHHDDKPFTVSGILAATGTPVDQAIFISLEGMEALHLNAHDHFHDPLMEISAEEALLYKLEPTEISAILLKTKNPQDLLGLQRELNNNKTEALSAVIPGIALQNIWSVINKVASVLELISMLVAMSSFITLLLSLLSSIQERRREIAIYRAVGSHAAFVYKLLLGEALLITFTGCLLGYLLLVTAAFIGSSLAQNTLGINLSSGLFLPADFLFITIMCLTSLLVGLLPAWRLQKLSLHDGMTIKL